MSDDYYVSAKELVSRMTLEEKTLLLTGDGWWATHRIDRLGIPSISMTDGPHGVRKGQGAGLSKSDEFLVVRDRAEIIACLVLINKRRLEEGDAHFEDVEIARVPRIGGKEERFPIVAPPKETGLRLVARCQVPVTPAHGKSFCGRSRHP